MVAGVRKIFLYSPPGSGNSAVGRLLADRLARPFIDLDALIENQAGRTIPEILSARDETVFREMEARALEEVCSGGAGVVALGGGTLVRQENRVRAESAGTVVCLEAELSTLVERVCQDEARRPRIAGDLQARLASLLDQRSTHYRSFPLRLRTDERSVEEIVWQIQSALGYFRIHGMGDGYDVLVESGGLDSLGNRMRERSLGGPVALVTDDHVQPFYAARAVKSLQDAGYETAVVTLPEGEAHKILQTVEEIWHGCLQAGLDRRSTLVALGGGVVSDLAGFAASTFLRGIPWVVVPTSLLSMVDASLGGKTGFDLPEGKNLAGAFYPPRMVLADPLTLSTLPDAEYRSGLAEVVKHGIIRDPELVKMCAGGLEAVQGDITNIVRRAMAVKVAIIEEDPYEQGERAALNLGHTLGHAVEAASNYQLKHGEAISIGMVGEARLSERLHLAASGLSEEIAAALESLGLPLEIPKDLPRETLLRCMKVDKKKANGVVCFSLPLKIGRVEVGVGVEDLGLLFD